jgi:uncharacterized protein YndB with AHSA1/START domain
MIPLERSVRLPLDRLAAFRLFTERMSDWWPQDRRHTGDARSRLLLEAGGRFVEISGERVVDLGRVLAWEEPARLLLSWYPGTDAEHPTEVEITFTAVDGGTRVAISHRPTAASEALWSGRVDRYAASWDKVLSALVAW